MSKQIKFSPDDEEFFGSVEVLVFQSSTMQ